MTVTQFIDTTLPAAARAAAVYGVNPIGMMAQAALETGWGKSAPGNMYFGIKATPSWRGKTQQLWTTEYVNGVPQRVLATFRAYDTPAQSFADYGALISSTPRYRAALSYPAYSQADDYIRAIAAAGYATAPDYANTVISVANTIKCYVSEERLAAAQKKNS